MTSTPDRGAVLRRLGLAGLVVGLVGLAGCVPGYSVHSEAFFAAYLTAFFFWLDLSLGCLGLAMLHGLSGGGWGIAIRRVIEAGYQTLPWMALALLPLWLNVEHIYVWTDSEYAHHHVAVARKAAWLNVDAFRIRAGVYFAVWCIVGVLLHLTSPRGDTTPDSPRSQRMQPLSGLGFIAYGVTITLASVDWVMSLEPTWFSTMYGVLYMAGEAVAGLSFALIVVGALGRCEPWSTVVTVGRRHDLGNLLLAFVLFSAYVHFMQFLIIWSGNLPEENVWYLHRSHGVWQVIVVSLVLFHFAAPFLLLLSREQKRRAENLTKIAAVLLVMRYVELCWLIVPGFEGEAHHGASPEWSATASPETYTLNAVAAFAAIGGIWIALFAWRLAARAAVPIYDSQLAEEEHGHAVRPAAT